MHVALYTKILCMFLSIASLPPHISVFPEFYIHVGCVYVMYDMWSNVSGSIMLAMSPFLDGHSVVVRNN